MHLARETSGEGPDIVLLHGLTASRDQVVHGSKRLERAGYRTTRYDARSHGASDPPEPEEEPATAYSYESLARDLAQIVKETVVEGEPFLLVGSSMGAHTAARFALDQPERLAGIVFIGPASDGSSGGGRDISYWDELSNGLREGGVDGFIEVFARGLAVSDDWKQRIVDMERDLISRHQNPSALADAIQWVPRSKPFDSIEELGGLEIPALVVASQDETDPGHPLAIAEAWAEALPRASLVVDSPGETPLAWSGGRLCGVIADFARTEAGLAA